MQSNYQQLTVWQKSMILVEYIYKLTKGFPKEELYGLTSQIRRSAVSIPSNIAEGSQRSTKKDFSNFIRIAKGSTVELETQLLIAERIGYIQNKSLQRQCLDLLLEIIKMLSGLNSKLKTPNS